jgi:hypothetical protein
LEDALEEIALLTALARRIHLDLCHALDDFPEVHPMLATMKERCEAFRIALGDTAAYRHGLHEAIEKLQLENESLRARLES